MELTVRQSDLSSMLARAAGIASAKSPLAVLKAVLLEANADGLTARATDTYQGVEERVAATVKVPGVIAVDAVRIAAVVKSLPAGDVTLKLVKDQLEVRAGKAKLKVPTMRAEDFPAIPQAADSTLVATVDARELVRGLQQGAYAMSANDNMPQLGSAKLEFDKDEMRVISSDARRITVSVIKVDCQTSEMLIPAKGVAELRKLADSHKGGSVELRLNGGTAFFVANGVALSSKLTDLKYVPWRKLFPETTAGKVTLHRDTLAGVVRRVALVAADTEGGTVNLTFSTGMLRVSGASTDAGEGEDFVECDSTLNLSLAVSPSIFAQAVETVPDDEVRLELTTELGPIVVLGAVSDEVRAICMPRRAG